MNNENDVLVKEKWETPVLTVRDVNNDTASGSIMTGTDNGFYTDTDS